MTAPEASGLLDGRTVLVPRSLDRAVGLAARLHELGARVLVSAVIERAPADDLAPLDDAVRGLARGAYAWVLVTSVNAVDELAAAWRRANAPGSLAADSSLASAPARWATVGPTTAKALRDAGVEPSLVPEDHSALGLLGALRSVALAPDVSEREGSIDHSRSDKPDDGPRVLLPLGDLAQPTLERGLAAMGARPHVVTAYRTVTHPIDPDVRDAWDAGEVDAVVLTSGSVAREVARQLGLRDDVAGVAIGSPTARAAREAGLRIDAVATTADDAGLADATAHALTPDPSEPQGSRDLPRSDTSPSSPLESS
jgi:uroporphyrinogen-III synthase